MPGQSRPPLRRKTTPKVQGGKPLRKSRTALTPHPLQIPSSVPWIDRERPGPSHRHFLRKKDILEFIDLLPEWDELAKGLRGILLARGEYDTAGWHRPGLVAVCAWERDVWQRVCVEHYEEHADVFRRLGVPCERAGDVVVCQFTDQAVRDYQLLHILLHELGHHHDRITTRSKVDAARGEGYAERYALKYMDEIWHRYAERFGLPGLS
ncbi:MAG: hypothetical protein PVJ57_10685 [Phycisphaerae bacterium]|jgi:hypothetical protein